ncbi:hypothetical protein COCOR_06502 [Corallococcus coralloides DSM 2259]|uniref:Uncharacterized protein n=1 Tax=Corallococcus coralloides (strain ATCC 25202 / DSM 2259 / NBRC 100086 / M2) TaxID=1144275 RepID=H8MUH7_CORCM|nr:hypothetical protein [Corallococcus coralloides]AFE06958.1 hypothetical protein COCOR_06502 [Corallococcus coralloides DSM 2259]
MHPHDLLTVCAALATHLDEDTPQESDWHRRLARALFQHLNLLDLPQARAVASAENGAELRQALGDRDVRPLAPGFELTNAWRYRHQLLALPLLPLLEGHPFWFTFPRKLPAVLRPMAEHVSDGLLTPALAAERLVSELDRVIIAFWGCPVEQLDSSVTAAALEAQGLDLPQPPRDEDF